MKLTHQQSLLVLALLSLPAAVVAADAREATIPVNAGVAVEPAHRAHVISNSNRRFGIDPSRIVWVVAEPARTRVLLPAEERAILQARADEAAVAIAAAGASAAIGAGGAIAARIPDATVYFPFNSSRVIDAGPVNSLLPKAKAGQGIRLDGYTDQKGTDEFNMGLSLRRAISVSNLFTRAGVPASQIQVEAHGEASPVDALDDAKNRRVEITLVDGGAK